MNDVLKALDPEIPPDPSITVFLRRHENEDEVYLSQCVDPAFDMQMLTEGLATAIVICSEYEQRNVKDVLAEVVHNLEQGIQWHGRINRKNG